MGFKDFGYRGIQWKAVFLAVGVCLRAYLIPCSRSGEMECHGFDIGRVMRIGFGSVSYYTFSLLQQPGPKKFKLSKIELIYKAKKFKVPPFTI